MTSFPIWRGRRLRRLNACGNRDRGGDADE